MWNEDRTISVTVTLSGSDKKLKLPVSFVSFEKGIMLEQYIFNVQINLFYEVVKLDFGLFMTR